MVIGVLFILGSPQAGAEIDPDLAHAHFEEARVLAEQDGGRMWGVSLYGPMLLVDPASGTIVGNRADPDELLRPRGKVYGGPLPDGLGIANTAQEWAGVRWTTVVWPLPEDRYSRQRLMVHELFHRIQNEVGCLMRSPENAHLETRDGRIWLRLEWRALVEALLRTGDEKRRAVEDAILFRRQRHDLFPGAAEEEWQLERNEGLAEYTGLALSGLPANVLADRAAVRIARDASSDSFQRSFAYATGPAYGLLLDHAVAAGAAPGWRKRVCSSTGLGALLAEAYSVSLPEQLPATARKRAASYDGERVIAEETDREEERQKRVAAHRARFLDGPVLILPATPGVSYSFNPYGIETLPDVGQVLETTTVEDEWGELDVTSGGALMTRAGSGRVAEFRVIAPPDAGGRPVEGDGWSLVLADGWTVRAGERAGDWIVSEASDR